ncbi:hypothetical protein QQX98_002826 [Neonectria punicea]|uniref:Uncharacterized protein n=1 Tax=Neonectria punicea TaxID=979145 RepID=A0ABR1HGT2_9HYPO
MAEEGIPKSNLRVVRTNEAQGDAPWIDIVVVSDISNKSTTSQRASHSQWSWLLASAPQCSSRLIELDYVVDENEPIWTALVHTGDELVDLLLKSMGNEKVTEKLNI